MNFTLAQEKVLFYTFSKKIKSFIKLDYLKIHQKILIFVYLQFNMSTELLNILNKGRHYSFSKTLI